MIITALYNSNNITKHTTGMSIIGRRHFKSEHNYRIHYSNKLSFFSFLTKRLNFGLNSSWHGYCIGT
jgi:hypothetical protein